MPDVLAIGSRRGRPRTAQPPPPGAPATPPRGGELLWCVLALALFAGFVLRAYVSAGPQLAVEEGSDTTAYLEMAGRPLLDRGFLAGERAMVYPLLLKATSKDLAAAGLAQTLFSIACWCLLAVALSRLFRSAAGRCAGLGLVLLCASRTEVLVWNSLSLSESLSLSLFALWVAAWALFLRSGRRRWAILLVAASLPFAFVRDSNAYLVLAASGLLSAACLLRILPRRGLVAAAAGLVVFLGSFMSSWSSETRSQYNAQNVFAMRVLTDPANAAAFRRHGMPEIDHLELCAGLCGPDIYWCYRRIAALRPPGIWDFYAWHKTRLKRTYLRFLLLDPGYLLVRPLRDEGLLQYLFPHADWAASRPCSPALGELSPAGFRTPLPRWADGFLRGNAPAGFLLLFAASAAGALLGALADGSARLRWALPLAILVTAYPHYLVAWHGDAMEVPRHVLLAGVSVHLAFSALLAFAVDVFAPRLAPARRGRDEAAP